MGKLRDATAGRAALQRLAIAVLFVIGLILLDRVVASALRYGYDRIETGEAGGQINAALRRMNSDVLIFGSSLARYHVTPQILSERLGVEVFNTGCDGQGMYYSRMLQSLMMSRGCQSKLMLVVLNWTDLYVEDLNRAKMFAVFMDEDAVIRKTLTGSSLKNWLKLQSHCYRFNTLAVSIGRHLVCPPQTALDGFVAVDSAYAPPAEQVQELWQESRTDLTNEDHEIMGRKLRVYRDFVEAGKRHGAHVVFVLGPTFRAGIPVGPREHAALRAFRTVAESGGATFVTLDEKTVPQFRSQGLFRDQRHLNAVGASVFTSRLADALDELSELQTIKNESTGGFEVGSLDTCSAASPLDNR